MEYNGVSKPNKLFPKFHWKLLTHTKNDVFFVLCTAVQSHFCHDLTEKKFRSVEKLNKCKIIVGTHAPKLFPGVGLKLKFDEQKPNKKMRLSVSCREEDRQLMWLWKKCCCSHHHSRLANMCMEYHGCVCVCDGFKHDKHLASAKNTRGWYKLLFRSIFLPFFFIW